MKIAIISDTHDHLINLEKALGYINTQGIKHLIHAGDLARPQTLEYLVKNFSGQVHVVGGNADLSPEENERLAEVYPNLSYYDQMANIKLGGVKIGVTHKPSNAKILAQGGQFNLVIHGHDHKPWQSFINKCQVLNPGNLCDQRFDSTLAIFETSTQKAQLMILRNLK